MSLNFNAESMEHFTLFRWNQMEVLPNGQLIRQELNMELDTVMLNALMIWSLFGDRLTARIGKMIKENMELVALSLMYGKLISGLMPIQLIHARFQAIIDVQVKNVEMDLKDKKEYVIKMVVIWTLSEMEIRTSMGQDQTTKSIQQNH